VPLNRLTSGGLNSALQVQKEILRRMGIIKTSFVRGPADPLDEGTLADLDEVCANLGIR
jgi:hypothetical protein